MRESEQSSFSNFSRGVHEYAPMVNAQAGTGRNSLAPNSTRSSFKKNQSRSSFKSVKHDGGLDAEDIELDNLSDPGEDEEEDDDDEALDEYQQNRCQMAFLYCRYLVAAQCKNLFGRINLALKLAVGCVEDLYR